MQRGAQPWLLVNAKPYTASVAGDWWRQVADVAGIVREVYFPAPLIYRRGPIYGNRTLRQSFRNGILDFTKIGIPVSKLGLFLGFQTTKGTGGREGLGGQAVVPDGQMAGAGGPVRRARDEDQLAVVLGLGGVDDDARRARPRETEGSVRLPVDARTRSSATGRPPPGKGFNRSRTEGQLILSPGLRCRLGTAAVRWSAINPILKLTGDPELAFSNAFARAVEQKTAPVSYNDILAAERSIVAARFGGSRGAYQAAIVEARANLSVARGIIGDELRRARIQSKFRVGGAERGRDRRLPRELRRPAGATRAGEVAEHRGSAGAQVRLRTVVGGAAAADGHFHRAAGRRCGRRSVRCRYGRSARRSRSLTPARQRARRDPQRTDRAGTRGAFPCSG